MNLDNVTLEDAIENYECRNRNTILENGMISFIQEGVEYEE